MASAPNNMRDAVRGGETPEDAAERIFGRLSRAAKDDLAMRALLDEGYDTIKAMEREVRKLARDAAAEFAETMEAHPEYGGLEFDLKVRKSLALRDLRLLAPMTFAVGDSRARVSWGEATADLHRARIALLTRRQGALETQIEMHENVLRILAAAGVDCLDDVLVAATQAA